MLEGRGVSGCVSIGNSVCDKSKRVSLHVLDVRGCLLLIMEKSYPG